MTGMLGNEAGYTPAGLPTLLMLGRLCMAEFFTPDKAKIVQVDIDPTHLGRRHPSRRVLSATSRRRWRRCADAESTTDASFRAHTSSATPVSDSDGLKSLRATMAAFRKLS